MLDWLWAPFAAVGELIDQGGPAVVWIFIACIVMWGLIFERYWYFKHQLPRDAEAALRKWREREDKESWKARQIRVKLISELNAAMTSNFLVMKVLVPLSPLLGLLGTVTGMLEVFDAMAALGSADARSMASGVSQAMVCTMAGLFVSITGLYPVYYFQGRIRHETELLSDQFAY